MITFDEVTKRFGNTIAIDNLSFNIKNCRTTALIGGNGSGKTTLLRIISTIIKPTSGKVSLLEYDVLKNPSEARKKIGFMIGGDASLFNKLTAKENIMYFAMMQGLEKRYAEKRIDLLVSELKMNSYIDRRVEGFSRGMRQKVVFAQATIHDPEVLLLDEPSTGLDIHAIADVHSFIRLCKEKNKTIILSSHNMNEIEKMSDDVLIIDSGKMLYHGEITTLKQKYETDSIEKAFSIISTGGKQ